MMKMRISLNPENIVGFEDVFVSRIDAFFPVISANLEEGELEVDASSDPDTYSVLMVAVEALNDLGLDTEIDIIVEQLTLRKPNNA